MRWGTQRFWNGPGLLLVACLLLGGGIGLIYLVSAGSGAVRGLALAVIGFAIFAARRGFGEAAYAKAQHGYIWPRDPERMKPNAELEGSLAAWQMAAVGLFVAAGGVVWALADVVE